MRKLRYTEVKQCAPGYVSHTWQGHSSHQGSLSLGLTLLTLSPLAFLRCQGMKTTQTFTARGIAEANQAHHTILLILIRILIPCLAALAGLVFFFFLFGGGGVCWCWRMIWMSELRHCGAFSSAERGVLVELSKKTHRCQLCWAVISI